MGQIEDADLFDTSAALTVLDAFVGRPESDCLSAAASAWEAAWIACLTSSPAWAVISADEFASVVIELRSVVCIAGRSDASASTAT
jgi:hypothetical protein